jgi:hypothetical protein
VVIAERYTLPMARWEWLLKVTPGWTRTSGLAFWIRNLRWDDFATPEETTKSTFSLCWSTTSESMSGFASTASFTAQRAEKAADLRNPQIQSWPSKTND